MRVIDVLTSPWAIIPAKLQEICEIYATHLRGEKIDIKGIEAKLGRPLENDEQGYEVVNGVAVLPIDGVIAKKMNLFSRMSGGASTQLIGRDLRAALADPNVKSILLHIDSPGGSVDGTAELASLVHAARGQKPIVAFADGVMASAAYWIGSAAEDVLIASQTTQVGSIGVVATHVDMSRREEMIGVKTTEIYAGKYKRIASNYKPLSEEGRQSIQDQVDYLYSLFVGTVAQHRGVDAETVLASMADGRIFYGQQAIDAGLVDGASTMDALIADMAAGKYPKKKRSQAAATAPSASAVQVIVTAAMPVNDIIHSITESLMDIEKLKAEHPALVLVLHAEGAAAELARIQSVFAQSMAGHEKLIQSLAFDGKTTGEQAAVQVLNAERGKRTAALDVLRTEGASLATVRPSAQPHEPAPALAVDPNAHLPVEERCSKRWESDATVRAEFPDLAAYTAFEKAVAGRKVKILGAR